MRMATLLMILLAVGALTVSAQEPVGGQEALRVGESEVRVVQHELFRRGHLKSRPTGVLDGETREALRAYQEQEGLEVTGKIDQPTVTRLGLAYPLSVNPVDEDRRPGLFPRIGSAVKGGVSAGARTVKGAAGKVGRGVKGGAEATVETAGTAVDKSGEAARTAGAATAGGARSVGRGVVGATEDVGEVLVGRSDADIHDDVREVLNGHEQTRYVKSEVKDGKVVLVTASNPDHDLSDTIGRIRRLSGVKSVVVIDR